MVFQFNSNSHILYYTIVILNIIKIYSKGARGLPVPLFLFCIFTKTLISINIFWRQQGSRYTIHAGRNLPDKEFRYLRTVRYTAAVYWRLKSLLMHKSLFSISTGQVSDPILLYKVCRVLCF